MGTTTPTKDRVVVPIGLCLTVLQMESGLKSVFGSLINAKYSVKRVSLFRLTSVIKPTQAAGILHPGELIRISKVDGKARLCVDDVYSESSVEYGFVNPYLSGRVKRGEYFLAFIPEPATATETATKKE
jgi:hypothetical protein